MNAVAAGIMSSNRTHIRNTAKITVLFFLPFFAYFSYQKQGNLRCFQGFQRSCESKLYPHLFSVFSLFNRQGSPLGTGEYLNGDRFFREKEGKKARTIRSSLGKMLQIAYAYIHTLIRMPAIHPQHIPTPPYIITTHIPYISHICLCNPIYNLSLRFPRPLPFPSICPFLHLIRAFLHHICTMSNTLYKAYEKYSKASYFKALKRL